MVPTSSSSLSQRRFAANVASGASEIRSLLTDTHALGQLTGALREAAGKGTLRPYLEALARGGFTAKRPLGRSTFGNLMEQLSGGPEPDRARSPGWCSEYWTGLTAALRRILLIVPAHQRRPEALEADLNAAQPSAAARRRTGTKIFFLRPAAGRELFSISTAVFLFRARGASVRQAVPRSLEFSMSSRRSVSTISLASLSPEEERGIVVGKILLLRPVPTQGAARTACLRAVSSAPVDAVPSRCSETTRMTTRESRLERESTYLAEGASGAITSLRFSSRDQATGFYTAHLAPKKDWHL